MFRTLSKVIFFFCYFAYNSINMKFNGYRVCPKCGKEGKMLPKSNSNPNSIIRIYSCQSCYWTGPMFRAIKKHSFLEYYLLLFGLIVFIIGAIAGFFYLLSKLPN